MLFSVTGYVFVKHPKYESQIEAKEEDSENDQEVVVNEHEV